MEKKEKNTRATANARSVLRRAIRKGRVRTVGKLCLARSHVGGGSKNCAQNKENERQKRRLTRLRVKATANASAELFLGGRVPVVLGSGLVDGLAFGRCLRYPPMKLIDVFQLDLHEQFQVFGSADFLVIRVQEELQVVTG